MKHCFKKAYAKINLTLDVLGKREDGYHELCMVMQRISLCDTVSVRAGCAWEGVQVVTNLGYLPADDRNIACKAAKAFFATTGIASPGGIQVAIHKRIPVAAGLAGGSADGAAVLLALDELYGTQLGIPRLCEIGLKVGADVPFCICGGTMLAEGVGEILTPLPSMPRCFVVLCKPGYGMSTPKVFAALDGKSLSRRPDTPAMVAALEAGDLGRIGKEMCNVLEEIVSAERRDIRKIRSSLLNAGALGAMMSGSGSTVFGLFSDQEAARNAYEKLVVRHRDTFLAETTA